MWGTFDLTHSVPLSGDVLGGEVGVRVDPRQLDAVGLGDLQDLVVDAQSGHALLVGLGQSGLELVVSCDEALQGKRTQMRKYDKGLNLILLGTEIRNKYALTKRKPSKYLNLFNAVDNKHILQVLHGSVHPVVEGRRPLGELQVQLVNGLPQLLHALP